MHICVFFSVFFCWSCFVWCVGREEIALYTPKIDLEFNSKKHFYAHPNKELSLCSNFPIRGRKTARTRVMSIFHYEKKKFLTILSYLCVTCHFIDDEWKMHKWIINFMHLKGSHSETNLSVAFMQNMASWNLDDKLFALSLDNVSSSKTCVNTINSPLRILVLYTTATKLFHVRCAAHIINLIARMAWAKFQLLLVTSMH